MFLGTKKLTRFFAISIFPTVLMAATPALADTELFLCNKTGGNMSIALAYQHATTGRWTLSAWYKRKPGECKRFNKIKTGLFYYHAKNDRGSVWPSSARTEKSYCVPSTAVSRDMNNSSCGIGDTRRNFRGHVVSPGKYTFTFS